VQECKKQRRDMSSGAATEGVLGFVGTGTIASAVVRGLCTAAGAPVCRQLLLSPRSASRSAALAAEYPTCSVAATNQQVVDGAACVFICLRAQDAADELRSLRFRAGQTIGAAPHAPPQRHCEDHNRIASLPWHYSSPHRSPSPSRV